MPGASCPGGELGPAGGARVSPKRRVPSTGSRRWPCSSSWSWPPPWLMVRGTGGSGGMWGEGWGHSGCPGQGSQRVLPPQQHRAGWGECVPVRLKGGRSGCAHPGVFGVPGAPGCLVSAPRVPAEPVSALDAALSAEGRTVGKGGLGLGHHRGGTLPHPAPQARPGTCLLCASVSPVAKTCVGVLAVGGQGLGFRGAHGRPVRLSQNPSARPSWRRPERVSVGAGTRQPTEGEGWLDPWLEVGAWGLAPHPGSS